MPLITIQAFPPNDAETLLTSLRNRCAEAFETKPDNIWVQLLLVQPGHYLQGVGSPAQKHTHGVAPPILRIQAQAGRTREQCTALTRVAAETVAEHYGLHAHDVWVYFETMQPRDVWFQGRWSGEA